MDLVFFKAVKYTFLQVVLMAKYMAKFPALFLQCTFNFYLFLSPSLFSS